MLRTRVIPCLLLRNGGLVKTVRFKDAAYVGDPINTVRIFNEKEVDELIFLDITATTEGREPRFDLLSEIATECFMPFSYGGGVNSIQTMERLFSLGVEKVAINTAALESPDLIRAGAEMSGSQAIVVSMDARRSRFGRYEIYGRGGSVKTGKDPVSHAKEMEQLGAGEILLTSIDREGTFSGFDTELISRVSEAVSIPVVANGGAGSLADLAEAVDAGAAAVAAGSLVVYQGRHRGVLINFPSRSELERVVP